VTRDLPRGEVELKYRVRDAEALRELLGSDDLGGLSGGTWHTVELEDRYIDTEARDIAEAGFAARLRRTPTGTVISVKSREGAGSRDGGGRNGSGGRALHRRAEHEAPATPALDPRAWPASPTRALVTRLTDGRPLRERFTIAQRRHERELHGARGQALLSLDEVEFLRDGAVLGRVTGLEVELRGGDETLLEPIAAALEASDLLEPEERSKEQIAQALIEAAASSQVVSSQAASAGAGRAGQPASPGVHPEDTLAEAGRKVLAFHFARMLSFEQGARSGRDLEDVHKMRVATRRMRAVWRTFRDGYRRKVARRYVAELRVVAAELGAVRDLDVLLAGLETHAREQTRDRRALRPFVDELGRRREAAGASLIELLDDQAYRDFVDDYRAFVQERGAGARRIPAGQPQQVRDTADSRIWAAYERVRAYEAVVAWADISTLHALRIEAKRLRYSLESFREVLGPEAGSLIKRVVALQDHLGELNDAQIAADLARAWLIDQGARIPDRTVQAVARYIASREAAVTRLRAGLRSAWEPLAAEDFRRDLAASLAPL
jgi:triphosphatase